VRTTIKPLLLAAMVCILVLGYLCFFSIMIAGDLLISNKRPVKSERSEPIRIRDLAPGADLRKKYCFNIVDINKDNKIDRSEFPFPPQFFDRIDDNGDGIISREEWNY